jgi:hypothetical protein
MTPHILNCRIRACHVSVSHVTVCAMAIALLAASPGPAAAQGYNGYPYSIMTPEPGSQNHHRAVPARRGALHGRVPYLAKRPAGGPMLARRGSSGSVLPTPLPRTPLIPPEGGAAVASHGFPQEQGPTFAPGAPGLGPVPNLPHGAETFQDRASRCSFQQGLSNVPAGASTQYMGACVQ